jgi:TIR domain-containing protein/tetratricopeptide repeat protein
MPRENPMVTDDSGVKRAEQVNRWLELAPSPPPLAAGKTWHVFLSYRSANRSWVLHLYDALRSVGFQVFLDQLEIAAGDSLVRRLNNALTSSQSGVIVWSTLYEDSTWCQAEYDTMEALRNDRSAGFRFVVAKLRDANLPALVKKDVFVDFSDYPGGPQGGELLKLMYGIVGKPLPDKVLRAAQLIDERTSEALTRIAAAKQIGNVQGLVALAKEGGDVWQASPLLYCAAAEALIEQAQYDRALEILALSTQFKHAIRPIQLNALAFARKAKLALRRAASGQLSESEATAARAQADALLGSAQQQLAELETLGHRDPETLGIFARTWMDRFEITGQRVYLEKSRNLYQRAFELNDTDYYTGINAAAKSVLLGDLELARRLAQKVEALIGTEPLAKDYWKTATVAEVQLIQGNFERAAVIYRAAVIEGPEATASHASSRGQAELLLERLNAAPEARAKVFRAFEL